MSEASRLRRRWRIVEVAFEPPVLEAITIVSGHSVWLDKDWNWHEEVW